MKRGSIQLRGGASVLVALAVLWLTSCTPSLASGIHWQYDTGG